MADNEKLSKFLAYVLRHNPQEANLTLDDQGFTPVDDLWAAVNKRFGNRFTWPDLLAVVEGDKSGKKRYEIVGRQIRALYGHNVALTEVTYEPAVPPAFLFHGTNEKALKQIKVEGLKSLGRQYVHLTTSLQRAMSVAGRRTTSDEIVMLRIDSAAAHKAGIEFYHPEPEHYLAKEIPPAFIGFPSIGREHRELLKALIQNLENFYTKNTSKSTNLEEYLRALWGEISKNRDAKPAWALFVSIFSKAWTANPLPFDEAWLEITESPISSEYTEDEEGDLISGEKMEDFQFLQQQILYQIADLRRMREAGYFERSGMELYMGVTSPTGSSWYNLSISDFLDHTLGDLEFGAYSYAGRDEPTWRDLGELLHFSQIYE